MNNTIKKMPLIFHFKNLKRIEAMENRKTE